MNRPGDGSIGVEQLLSQVWIPSNGMTDVAAGTRLYDDRALMSHHSPPEALTHARCNVLIVIPAKAGIHFKSPSAVPQKLSRREPFQI